MYVLGQMLTPDSRTRVLGEATILLLKMNDLSMRQGERGNERALLPTERQAVPTTEPDWD